MRQKYRVRQGSLTVAKPLYGPRQANLVLITYASSEGSGEPAHLRSLARTFAAPSYKQWIKRNLQTENQIPGPSEWLGMRSWNLSWRNARRHKFAWRGPYICESFSFEFPFQMFWFLCSDACLFFFFSFFSFIQIKTNVLPLTSENAFFGDNL